MAALRGKVIAITGAASGIGRATAKLLAARGALLSLSDVNETGLATLSRELAPLHGESSKSVDTGEDGGGPASSSPSSHPPKPTALPMPASPSSSILMQTLDVRSASATTAWIRNTLSHFGSETLDGAANMAGVPGPTCSEDSATLMRVPAAEYQLVMDVNVGGVANCLRAQLPVMREGRDGRDGGAIVNVTSIASAIALPKFGAYTASKHAVLGLTRTAAREEGYRGIRVNAVAPGIIATPMVEELEARAGRLDFIDSESGGQPVALRRRGDATEVAQAIVFLLSENASYISGVNLPIDGGWLC